ncbi:MAG: argininosuccinate lyase [Clostridiales bacterium]|nr:argininosuccinate lyase [Clostridiales bacterium]MCK9350589.1 argininosuccinate lyase [Clostridiales bacterium]MDD3540555.1 argininosuccinate lyase [Eubacteriales bacterium]
MEKLWKGRSDAELNRAAHDFNASIHIDQELYEEDILGSIAHAVMLGETGIIKVGESHLIVAELKSILADIESGELVIDPTSEDIHSFIEITLTERIGDIGKHLHTGRSRNDQVALDFRMYIHRRLQKICHALETLILTFADLAEAHTETIMPGYTHLQRAQPVTFGHYLMAYAAMFLRDIERIDDAEKRLLVSPLGAGALAGTTHPIDRKMTQQLLGFQKIAQNSIDAVSDRDFAIETAFILSLIMAHLSRLSEEIILFSSWEFGFLFLSEQFSTGSSIMPQKKNPDIAELSRGKTGRVYGSLMALLTLIKGLPLAYNKDMQEDKELLIDALDTVSACLPLTCDMLLSMTVHKERMLKAAEEGYLNATDCADYLSKKGMPFRESYELTGRIVAYAQEQEKVLEELSLDEYQVFSPLFEEDIFHAITLIECVKARKSEGGTSPESVMTQIGEVRDRLTDRNHSNVIEQLA